MPVPLPDALPGEAGWLDTPDGRLRWYAAGSGRPVLVLHSFNAAGSAFEMRPVYEAIATRGRAIAVDWLGFGRSDRPDLPYDAALYRRQLEAVRAFAAADGPLDVVALSLPSQYVVLEAAAAPERYGRLVLVSPTGFGRFGGRPGPRGRLGWRVLRASGVGRLLYALLARRAVIGWFERQIFAAPARVPPSLVAYSWRAAQQPGAHHAPLRFISGLLNDGAAIEGYRAVGSPTLLLFGDAPRFCDPDAALALVTANPNLRVATIADSGDLPHWEQRESTIDVVLGFLG